VTRIWSLEEDRAVHGHLAAELPGMNRQVLNIEGTFVIIPNWNSGHGDVPATIQNGSAGGRPFRARCSFCGRLYEPLAEPCPHFVGLVREQEAPPFVIVRMDSLKRIAFPRMRGGDPRLSPRLLSAVFGTNFLVLGAYARGLTDSPDRTELALRLSGYIDLPLTSERFANHRSQSAFYFARDLAAVRASIRATRDQVRRGFVGLPLLLSPLATPINAEPDPARIAATARIAERMWGSTSRVRALRDIASCFLDIDAGQAHSYLLRSLEIAASIPIHGVRVNALQQVTSQLMSLPLELAASLFDRILSVALQAPDEARQAAAVSDLVPLVTAADPKVASELLERALRAVSGMHSGVNRMAAAQTLLHALTSVQPERAWQVVRQIGNSFPGDDLFTDYALDIARTSPERALRVALAVIVRQSRFELLQELMGRLGDMETEAAIEMLDLARSLAERLPAPASQFKAFAIILASVAQHLPDLAPPVFVACLQSIQLLPEARRPRALQIAAAHLAALEEAHAKDREPLLRKARRLIDEMKDEQARCECWMVLAETFYKLDPTSANGFLGRALGCAEFFWDHAARSRTLVRIAQSAPDALLVSHRPAIERVLNSIWERDLQLQAAAALLERNIGSMLSGAAITMARQSREEQKAPAPQ
jgi:hypothetical protein